jgi:thioredoxin-related protein
MQKILNKIIIIIFFFISACTSSWQDIKKGLGGEKRTSTDEFLVKKKEPLVMPPEWKNLPEPGGVMKSDDAVMEATDIEELMKLGKNEESSINYEQGSGSLEDSILKKIK